MNPSSPTPTPAQHHSLFLHTAFHPLAPELVAFALASSFMVVRCWSTTTGLAFNMFLRSVFVLSELCLFDADPRTAAPLFACKVVVRMRCNALRRHIRRIANIIDSYQKPNFLLVYIILCIITCQMIVIVFAHRDVSSGLRCLGTRQNVQQL